MASVTLPGANPSGIVTVQSGTGAHIQIAQAIANNILLNVPNDVTYTGGLYAGGGYTSTPNSVTINGTGSVTGPPTTAPGGENVLYLYGNTTASGGGLFVVPTGYNYVVDLMTGPETIMSGSTVQIISDDSLASAFSFSGASSIASADPVINDTGTQYISTGPGDNTVSLFGAGTISGSATGTDLYNVTPTVGGLGILVASSGTDTVNVFAAPGGGGVATVVATGNDVNLTANGVVTVEAVFLGAGDSVSGGAGASDVTANGSAALITGGIGTLSVVDTGTSDTIFAAGASAATVSAFGTGALVFGGLNAITVSLGGSAPQGGNTLVGGGGAASATLTGVGNDVIGGSGNLSVDDLGTSDTIGAFAATTPNITLGGSDDLLFGGSDTLAATVTGSDDTVAGGIGPSTITATSGAVVFAGAGLINFISGGGTSTILGATGDTQMVTVGSGGLLFFTGVGDTSSIVGGNLQQTTIIGGSGSNVFVSSLSGSGGFEFMAGSGNETLSAVGSTTNNTFAFFESQTSVGAGGHDTISGWTTIDSLDLLGYSSATSVAGGGNVTFSLSDGTQITFTNATEAEFNGRILHG